MKIKIETRRMMLTKIEKVCAVFNINPADVKNVGTMHTIWNRVCWFTQYPSDNPNALFKGKRVFNQDVSFELYPDNSNDDSLTTALKWCFSYLAEKQLTK